MQMEGKNVSDFTGKRTDHEHFSDGSGSEKGCKIL
mgnify:CR=1 FL=1